MRTAARSACVVVLALVLGVAAAPARAKGPTDVVVEGPGIDGRHLTFTPPGDDVDAGSVGVASRLDRMWEQGRLAPAPDLGADQLGPRYVLTWSTGLPHEADTVVQHAYPFAEGGGWVRFPPGQILWGAPISSGWVRTPRLADQLVALGAVEEPADPAVVPAPITAPSERVDPEQDASSAYDAAVPAGILLAVVVGVAGVLVVRRRRLSR
jgi:hypothetical protein